MIEVTMLYSSTLPVFPRRSWPLKTNNTSGLEAVLYNRNYIGHYIWWHLTAQYPVTNKQNIWKATSIVFSITGSRLSLACSVFILAKNTRICSYSKINTLFNIHFWLISVLLCNQWRRPLLAAGSRYFHIKTGYIHSLCTVYDSIRQTRAQWIFSLRSFVNRVKAVWFISCLSRPYKKLFTLCACSVLTSGGFIGALKPDDVQRHVCSYHWNQCWLMLTLSHPELPISCSSTTQGPSLRHHRHHSSLSAP